MTGSDIVAFRDKLGLSQAGLALRLKVSPNTVARWERGVIAVPPLLDLALETVAARIEEERRKRGPGRPRKDRRTRRAEGE